MITEFDKNGALTLYKREFTDGLDAGDYERALDNLLKYAELSGYEDFHLACGMLYLLMAQDSDDNELLTMSFRELMMYLRKHPDCKLAYRDILGVLMLRHDTEAIFNCTEWIKANGFDPDAMFSELSDAGFELFPDENMCLDIDGMFEPGEFGEIEITPKDDAREEEPSLPPVEKPSKVIRFRGGANGADDENACASKSDKKVLRIERPDDGDIDISELFDIARMASDNGVAEFFDDDDDDELDIQTMESIRKNEMSKRTGMAAQMALKEAERYGMAGDYDKVFEMLDEIKPSDGQYYYCAECMRAFTFMQLDDPLNAHITLEHALDARPNGALAGTLLCRLYEMERKFESIPDVLKNIDVHDYTDASHAYQAMQIAIRYCTPQDAAELAEDYIDEFNTMDVRMLYAQLLYNIGRRKDAARELYVLSRIFYDDFGAQYYYAQAVSGVKQMPVDEDAPQSAIAKLVDGFMWIHRVGKPSDELIDGEDYKVALELFLTLEFRNDRKLVTEMFDVLKKLAADPRLDGKMRDTLVSPYAEPLVKAVLLSALLERSDDFLLEIGFSPISPATAPAPLESYSRAFKTAYAYMLALGAHLYPQFTELVEELGPKLVGTEFSERDKAYYILKQLKRRDKRNKLDMDGRVEYSLGYETKSAATQAYKAMETELDGRA